MTAQSNTERLSGFTPNLARLLETFDPVLDGATLSEQQHDQLYALAHVFDLKAAQDPTRAADVWRSLRTVLLRQRRPGEEGGAVTDPRTLLIVEDDPDVAGSLIEGLVAAGHHVVGPAATADAAASLAGLHAIDVALVDINLAQEGDGVELARRLKDRWDLKVVFLSANVAAMANNADVCDAFIIKPYRVADALAAVADVSTAG